MVFHWRLSDSKSPQFFRTLLSILADLNNAVFWMVATRPLISKSSCPFTNPSLTVSRAPITIGIIVTFIFHNFFQSPSKIHVLIRLFTFFIFYSVASRHSKVLNFASSLFLFLFFLFFFFFFFFLLIIIRSGRLAETRRSVCISKFQRSLCVSFSWTDAGLCIYHLFIWSNLNFLYNSQWITLPTQLCLVLYSFCANLLHYVIDRFVFICT